MAKMNFCTLVIRLIAFAATVSAAIVMATSHETSDVLTVTVEAKYSHSPALKYFVIANSIASVYGLLVLFLPRESLLWRLVVALDVVFTMLLTSCLSAAAAVAYVAKKGNSHAGWLPICDQVSNYCDHVTGALVIGFIAVIIYMGQLLYSIHVAWDPLLLRKS